MQPEILKDIAQWMLLLLTLLLFYLLWKMTSDSWSDEKERALGGNGGSDDVSYDQQDPASERRANRKKIRKILSNDPKVAKALSDLAGTSSQDLEQLDDPGLDKIADQLGTDLLDILYAASTNIPIELDLDSEKTTLVETRGGGTYRDTARITGPEQIPQMVPEDLVLPPAARRIRLATGEARRTRYYNQVPGKKILLYLLRDRSGSMTTPMRLGLSRDAWARGVCFKYALMALAGKTQFYFRDFDAEVKTLEKVLTQNDVAPFIEYLRMHPAPSSAGTDILNGLRRAARDIKAAKEKGISSADIVLISDGNDNSVEDPKVVKSVLGDIRLHVIMIGCENLSLKEVATTYVVI